MEDIVVLRVDTGLKRIKVNDYGDCIIINLEDSTMTARFAKLIQNIENLAGNAEKENVLLDKKYAGRDISEQSGFDAEQVIERSELQLKYINLMMAEIDAVFGKDCIKKVYRECYEADKNFIPSEAAIIEFIEKITPVMAKFYEERFEFNKRKFNSARRGKQTDIHNTAGRKGKRNKTRSKYHE